jgi:renalase
MRIAIVGAGIAGLTAGRALAAAGAAVELFDKGRGLGGRVSTRRRENGAFDHGAQRFSARSPAFVAEVAAWAEAGAVAATEPASEGTWWLPTPSASALPRHLGAGLAVQTSTRVTGLRRRSQRLWLALEGAPEVGPFDRVLVTAPAPQAAALLGPLGAFERELGAIAYAPTWAVLALTEGSATSGPVFTTFDEGPIELVAHEDRKPGRAPGPPGRLVVHASSAFSEAHLEASDAEVLAQLVPALERHAGRVLHAEAHRWRFARVVRPLGEAACLDRARGVGIAGDGLLGPRIEAAWQSGRALAALTMS